MSVRTGKRDYPFLIHPKNPVVEQSTSIQNRNRPRGEHRTVLVIVDRKLLDTVRSVRQAGEVRWDRYIEFTERETSAF